MKKLVTYIYSGVLGNTSKLAMAEMKDCAECLQLQVKLKEESSTPKAGKTKGRKAAGSPDLESPTVTPKTKSRPCLLYTSPSPRDKRQSRMPSSA